MWQFISEQISEHSGHLFVCQNRQPVPGGDTHQCAVIRDDSRRYFVKYRQINSPLNTELDAEADGLKALAVSACIHTPKVICHGVVEENHKHYEYLVLQYLKLSQTVNEDWHTCGKKIAHLHKTTAGEFYGWPRDNFIGRSPQINTTTSCWATFFAESRIGVMLEQLAHEGHVWCNIDVCTTQIYQFLKPHQPQPSLLHGDLWSGNVGFSHQQPVVFDPAVYYGDRETDIAMTELFGRLPEAFYQGYNAIWPLHEDYPQRRKLYQLYHILNHAVLFGGHYLQAAQDDIIQLNQQLL
ncbi:fructosamine kinase family protein [Alteromonas lipolytica]|uniref:Fructosamine kinase n=1 Tax=Alteromonas lipolytica TaxID=1856405 RepID=A0A1E8FKC3_9ALTE|nr:fructosamine kinase family protein [Alteromonas lipolytica]OFI36399.1 hypothetical protein BFC17_00520 [Alteromonas lipolytica]GGF70229.1 fructosamine kinase family protein [Alteromonas lipolytica]